MNRRLLFHAAFWLAYWFIFAYTYSRYDGNLGKYLCTEALQLPFRMMATYLALWFMGRYKNAWMAFGGAALAVLFGGLTTRIFKLVYLVPVWFPDSTISFWNYRLMIDVFDCALAAAVALSARMYFRQQELLRQEAALRAEKTEAELRALKSQLQPHFLFNTINNLYALARIKSDKTAPVALQLAQLLRYVLYEAGKESVEIEAELKLIEDYIALEKLRFDEGRLRIKLTTDIDQPSRRITPLLLLPLVENAFKHGAAEQYDDAWINIDLRLRQGTLCLNVENSLPRDRPVHQSGIGLSNLQRQLELCYPGNGRLTINPAEKQFHASLQISDL